MSKRLEVLKTYKLYINGKFPRTESGRYYAPKNQEGEELGNICLASRKDFRNSVAAARKAQASWSGRSAYNVGQILYRIAENLEARKEEFSGLLRMEASLNEKTSKQQIEESIDLLIYYAGWSDKFQQLFSGVNPVASSHFNFSIMEPSGVVAAICGASTGFKDFVAAISTSICSGNSIVILANEKAPLSAISFAEVLQHSDVPGGVINILTGKGEELESHFATHMDVNTLLLLGDTFNFSELEQLAAVNLKRVRKWSQDDLSKKISSPYALKDLLETKTTWHPIEQIGGAKAGY